MEFPINLTVGFLNGIGVVAVVVVVGWLLATGRLVTRREAENMGHDRDEWRTEARLKDQTITELTEQNQQLLEVGRTVKAIFTAISRERPDEVNR